MIHRIFAPSLRTGILLLILLAMAPLTVMAFFNAAEQRAANAVQVHADALRLARLSAISHEQLIEGARQVLIVLSQLPAVRNGDAPACNALFADLLRQYPYYSTLAVLTPNGDVFCSAVPFTEPVNAADRPWFQRVLQTHAFTLSEYQVGRITHKAVLTTAYPVTDETGAILGIVTASIDIAWLNQLVGTAQLSAGASFTVVDRAGTVLAYAPDPEAWVGQSVAGTPLFSAIQNQSGGGTVVAAGLDGQTRLFGFTALRTLETSPVAYLAVGVPMAEAYAETARALVRNLVILSGVAIVGFFAAWLLGNRWFLRRIGRLVQTADRLGAGEWRVRTDQGDDRSELGLLARALNDMAAALEERETRQRSATTALLGEVTERKEVEAALRLREANLSALLENTADRVWSADPQYRLIIGNAPFQRGLITAFGRAFAPGESVLSDQFPQEVVAAWQEHYDRALRGESFAFEAATQFAPTPRYMDYRFTPIRVGEQIVGVTVAGHDITEYRQAEAALRESEARYRTLIENVGEGIGLVDPAEQFTFANPAAEDIFGVPPGDLLGRSLREFTTPEQFGVIGEQTHRRRIGAKSVYELEVSRHDGAKRSLLVTAVPRFDSLGEFVGTFGVFRDITGRKRAEEALQESEKKYRSLVEHINDVVFAVDMQGLFTYMSPVIEEISGYTPEELLGQPFSKFIFQDDLPMLMERFHALLTGEIDPDDYRIVTRTGDIRWVRSSSRPVIVDGKAVAIQGLISDITERKQADEALRQSRDQLQAVLDATPAAISWIGADLRYRGINRYLAEALGRPDTAVAGELMGFLGTSPELADFARDFFAGELAEDTRELVSENAGARRHYLIVARKFQDGQAAVLVGMDITERKQAEAALRANRAMLQQILDTIPQVVFWKDKASVYLGCNRAFARATGLTDPAQVIGKTDFDLPWPRQNAAVYRADDAQVVVSGIPKQHMVELQQQADGSRVWIDISKLPLLDAQGETHGVLGVYEDITDRKQAEIALGESEAKYRQLVESLNEGIWMIDEQAVTTFVNLRMVEMLGYTVEEMLGRHLFSFMDAQGIQIATRNLARRQQGIKEQHDFEFLRKDGTRIYTNLETAAVTDLDGNYRGAIAGVADITERKQAEEALREYAGQLRELTARLAGAEESERRRIAQELHDRVGQNLTALSINLNIVTNLLPPEPAVQVGPRLEDSLELVSETMEHIRDVMAELRPPVLDDYGLLAALRWYGQRFAQRTGLAVTTQGADPAPRPPLATEMALFRIAQEALTNVARHAQARQVTITLAAPAGGLRLTIVDDGIGFDPELRAQPNARRTLGLLTMTERAEGIGGRLIMDAAPGRGTRVVIECPAVPGIEVGQAR